MIKLEEIPGRAVPHKDGAMVRPAEDYYTLGGLPNVEVDVGDVKAYTHSLVRFAVNLDEGLVWTHSSLDDKTGGSVWSAGHANLGVAESKELVDALTILWPERKRPRFSAQDWVSLVSRMSFERAARKLDYGYRDSFRELKEMQEDEMTAYFRKAKERIDGETRMRLSHNGKIVGIPLEHRTVGELVLEEDGSLDLGGHTYAGDKEKGTVRYSSRHTVGQGKFDRDFLRYVRYRLLVLDDPTATPVQPAEIGKIIGAMKFEKTRPYDYGGC